MAQSEAGGDGSDHFELHVERSSLWRHWSEQNQRSSRKVVPVKSFVEEDFSADEPARRTDFSFEGLHRTSSIREHVPAPSGL